MDKVEVKEEKEFEDRLEPKETFKDPIKKTVGIQQVVHNNKQSFYIRIPMQIVDELQIKKGDKFTFELHLGKTQKENKISFKLEGH